jgi:hypothetical protein
MHNDTFEFTTDREVFNYISNHLLEQNKRSADLNGCVYRSGNLKCAVGAVISEKYYYAALEGRMVGHDSEIQEIVKSSIPGWEINVAMLIALQDIHDNGEPEDWALSLSRLSLNFTNNSFQP